MKNLFLLSKKIHKFFRLCWKDKLILFEAFLLSGIMRFAILLIPFNKLARMVGKYNQESSALMKDREKIIINKVAWAVLVVSRHTPWESKCLVKALTAQIMLSENKISSTLYLGLAKDEQKKMLAHAWLRSGTDIITGEDERRGFTQVAKFANFAEIEKL